MDIPINWDLVNNDIKEFGFEGEIKTSKVVDVYDGDTIKIVFPVLQKLFKFNCRITGVDTPEIRTRNLAEKEFGLKVRDELRKKILNKIVRVKCGDFDKYGRLLVEVITDENENIKEWLINSEYAFPYDGGKKLDWNLFLKKPDNKEEINDLN
jgi:endonuclease YncB( thermonuclease family)